MSATEPFPWGGLLIAGLTIVAIYSLIFLVQLIVAGFTACRDALRDHYAGGRWTPAWPDLVGIPAWWAFEIACLFLAVAGAVLTVFAAYQIAQGVRDWWHAGSNSHR